MCVDYIEDHLRCMRYDVGRLLAVGTMRLQFDNIGLGAVQFTSFDKHKESQSLEWISLFS